ncbi:MAG: polyketide synthase dehydratase domain-containing protein [Chloroflexota bacterium]|nr:polyketide synthase dehydratase domain-containing protein [Chloroflexota bacterium]
MSSNARSNGGAYRLNAALRGDIAIVGMACMYPQALSLDALWQNVVSGVDAISDMPPERVPPTFYDPESTDNDHTYCRRGGFLGDSVPFDPLQFGIMPVITECGDPEQLLALKVAHEALRDAGYDPAQMDGERTEVIIGRGNYANRALSTAQHHVSVVNEMLEVLKATRPDYTDTELATLRQELLAGLPRFGRENAASLVPNFTTGRIANRFDFMGTNFTVDAACASSLVALELGVNHLLTGKCDTALIGGAFIVSDLTHIAVLTQVGALSRRSEIRPFDSAADGMLLGEGVGILVLKRLEDAQQDGDRIYAVVKGVGTSSDGRGLGLLAPRVDGEELALRRAYEMAGLDPATIGLIEAHGTGTPTGDAAEIEALTRVFGSRDPDVAPHCAVGSIKSMIGHPLPAAGAAGLIKAALALYHKILPPSLHCEQPDPKLGLDQTPFYINTTTNPWIHGGQEHPRRAGVSAFGFGGANAHAILEEFRDDIEDERPGLLARWPTEVCVLEASDRAGLMESARELASQLADPAGVELKDVAYTLNSTLDGQGERLALVADSLDDLRSKLERAAERLADPQCGQIKDGKGIYYFSQPLGRTGKLAILFPGEGAQYVGMLGELCKHFPVVRRTFDRADAIGSISYVFPPPWPRERERAELRLWSTVSGAVEAVLAANAALYGLFKRLHLQPDAVLGHSSGDFTACLAAGIFSDDDAMVDRLAHLWQAYDGPQEQMAEAGLLAVGAAADNALTKLGDLAGQVLVAMDNCPHQIVLAGPADVIDRARERLLASNIFCERLPFSRPYHTQAFASQLGPVRASLADAPVRPPTVPIYSCTTAEIYPSGVEEIRRLMIEHWCRPVQFQETIRKMYADGVRIFLELGPRGNLTAFVEDILRSQSHLAICADSQRRHGLTQLNHVVALLSTHGVPLQLSELYRRRSPQRVEPGERPPKDRQLARETTLALAPIRLHLNKRPDKTADARPAVSSPTPASPPASPPVAQTPVMAVHEQSSDIAGPQTGFAGESAPLATTSYAEVVPAARVERQPVQVGQISGPGDEAGNAMIAYLQTMEQFLSVQQSVMQAFLLPGVPSSGQAAGASSEVTIDLPGPGAGMIAQPPTSPGTPPPPQLPQPMLEQSAIPAHANGRVTVHPDQYPLLGTITAHVAGQELQAERILSLDTDPFLLDHSFGRKISTNPELRPIATVPTTVSMEIMAEAAAALMPGLQVIGMRRIRSLQWINVTERPTTLRISAKHAGEEAAIQQVEVTIWSSEAGAEAPASHASPAAQGLVLLAASYPAAPAAAPFPLKSARPCHTTLAQLYEWLFHGPQFQMVRALHQVGEEGIAADLMTLPMERFLGARPSDSMILDPVVLDGAGQMSAAWVYERVVDPGIMFPIQIDEATFYGPRYRGPAVLPCHLHLRHFDYRQVRADMEIIGPDGRAHIRINGWQHYRVHCPPHRIRMSRDSRTELSGELWELPAAPLPSRGNYVASLVDGLSEKGSATMDQACAYIILSSAEREQWRALQGPTRRRAQWLLGRAAAKDAARAYLLRQYGLELYPADVEVITDARGRPSVTGAWAHGLPSLPAISLAHSGMIGVAIAGGASPDDYLGIDIERIRPRDAGFMDLAFSAHERAWLEALDEATCWEWATRFWCAKEAVAKAVGQGLAGGPTGLTVQQADRTTGRLEVILGNTLARSVPELRNVPIVAYTARHGDLAVASTVCERAE